MTTISQNNVVAGSLVLNDYLNSSMQNNSVIGKETAVGRFTAAPAAAAGPLDHTLKPHSGNGGGSSSLLAPKTVEVVTIPPRAGAFKKRRVRQPISAPPRSPPLLRPLRHCRATTRRPLQRCAAAT